MVGNAESEAQMGRPPKKDSQKRRNRMVLLFTDGELELIKAHIEDNGYDGQNDFGREAILEKVVSTKRSINTQED